MSGVESDTRTATVAGEFPDVASASVSPAPGTPPPAEVKHPGKDESGGVLAVHGAEGYADGDTKEGEFPTVEELQNQSCPNCTVGVLYVVRYDPDSLHEQGQEYSPGLSPPSLPKGFESGGAYEVKCFHCDWGASYALNPGKYHGRARD